MFRVIVEYQQLCKKIFLQSFFLIFYNLSLNRLTTNKPGVNQGRKFYKCDTCKFFEWEDNNAVSGGGGSFGGSSSGFNSKKSNNNNNDNSASKKRKCGVCGMEGKEKIAF